MILYIPRMADVYILSRFMYFYMYVTTTHNICIKRVHIYMNSLISTMLNPEMVVENLHK